MSRLQISLYRYCIEMYKSRKDDRRFSYGLAESKDFYGTKKLKDISYYKNGKFIKIYKY